MTNLRGHLSVCVCVLTVLSPLTVSGDVARFPTAITEQVWNTHRLLLNRIEQRRVPTVQVVLLDKHTCGVAELNLTG